MQAAILHVALNVALNGGVLQDLGACSAERATALLSGYSDTGHEAWLSKHNIPE